MLNFNSMMLESNTFRWHKFYSFLHQEVYDQCVIEARQYPYFKIEKTRTSNTNRIWLNQEKGTLGKLGKYFDNIETKKNLSQVLGINFDSASTRIELCLDNAGSWLESHKDDSAKMMTMQINLVGRGLSTKIEEHNTTFCENSAWAFDNKDQPIHSLNPLKFDRTTIIVNYVNDKWRDRSVLIK